MEQKLEAVLLDLDGSILNSKKMISDQDLETIRRLKEKGVRVHIVTGRPAPFSKQNAEEIGFDSLISCCNGGYIYDYQNGEVVRHGNLIDPEDVIGIRDYCLEHEISYLIYTLEGVIFDRPDSRRTLYWKKLSAEQFNENNKLDFVYDGKDIDLHDRHTVKILLAYISGEDAENIRQHFNKENRYEIAFSEKELLDINAAGINKGYAIEQLADTVGFDLRHAIVLGDNFNDEAMLKKAGYPIVPANGEEAMKRLAYYVTSSNDDSPLTKAIEDCFPGYL